MQSADLERAAFEAWARKHGQPVFMDDDEPGWYAYSNVQDNWEGWKARAALQSQDKEDAERYRHLMAKMQQAYDGECFESECFSVYCRMSNQYKGNRTILAEITWRDKSDEPIGLSEAIDHARRIEETNDA